MNKSFLTLADAGHIPGSQPCGPSSGQIRWCGFGCEPAHGWQSNASSAALALPQCSSCHLCTSWHTCWMPSSCSCTCTRLWAFNMSPQTAASANSKNRIYKNFTQAIFWKSQQMGIARQAWKVPSLEKSILMLLLTGIQNSWGWAKTSRSRKGTKSTNTSSTVSLGQIFEELRPQLSVAEDLLHSLPQM